MINPCTTIEDRGHLGKRGFVCNYVSGTHIIRYDIEKEQYIRDPQTGFLISCQPNEIGELIAAIKLKDPTGIKSFQGYYKNDQESKNKILTNVFKKGDMYFRTGDLFRFDNANCWHFVDRIGDTFRWKGENVSTNEVGETISKFPGLSEICIYGVKVPGNEGRACMAAMVFDEKTFDLQAFAAYVMEKLPSYAVPIFLRRLSTMSVTGTMKHEKAKMRKENMDPTKIQDPLWVLKRENKTYLRLTSENYLQTVIQARL
jgi:acyl-CoA synthetase (AMP-forming)/AMP-acid ligase II